MSRTISIAFILLAALSCDRSTKSPKVELETLSVEIPNSKERIAELHDNVEVLIKANQFRPAENCLSEALVMATV